MATFEEKFLQHMGGLCSFGGGGGGEGGGNSSSSSSNNSSDNDMMSCSMDVDGNTRGDCEGGEGLSTENNGGEWNTGMRVNYLGGSTAVGSDGLTRCIENPGPVQVYVCRTTPPTNDGYTNPGASAGNPTYP